MGKNLEKFKKLLESFNHFELERIPWLENDCIDSLAKLASMKSSNANQTIIQSVMLMPSIEKNEFICIEDKESWIDPIKAYLKN